MKDVCRFSRDNVVECSERTVFSCLEPICLCWRTKEHTRDVRASDTRRYETADHCWKYIHDFDWEYNRIMDHEANTTARKIKEQFILSAITITSMEYHTDFHTSGFLQ